MPPVQSVTGFYDPGPGMRCDAAEPLYGKALRHATPHAWCHSSLGRGRNFQAAVGIRRDQF